MHNILQVSTLTTTYEPDLVLSELELCAVSLCNKGGKARPYCAVTSYRFKSGLASFAWVEKKVCKCFLS